MNISTIIIPIHEHIKQIEFLVARNVSAEVFEELVTYGFNRAVCADYICSLIEDIFTTHQYQTNTDHAFIGKTAIAKLVGFMRKYRSDLADKHKFIDEDSGVNDVVYGNLAKTIANIPDGIATFDEMFIELSDWVDGVFEEKTWLTFECHVNSTASRIEVEFGEDYRALEWTRLKELGVI